ncbi:MAG: hypothetical protein M1546_08595 [Chloroflexi bacterium]|nr:hypothetical protein [Chloroflexota bacterium]
MNDRERILAVLTGRTPDRVPWLADLTYWASAMERRGEVPAGFQSSEAYYQFHRELGAGFYLQGYEPFRAIYGGDVQVVGQVRGNVRRREIHTPLGMLSEEWTYLPESYAEAPTAHLLKSPQDLPAFSYWIEHTRYEPDYAEAERRYRLVQDLGVVLCYLPKSPFMQLVALLAGIETVVNLWAEAPEAFGATLRLLECKSDEAAAIALASPAECLMIPENLSSEVVGTRFFESYLRGYEEKWINRIHAAGKHSFIHMDGTLRGLIRQVASTGIHVIEAVTPMPVGDLTFPEMRTLAGAGTILWGGIPGIYYTPLVDDAEFDRHVCEVLAIMRQWPGYVLGVADQVPPDGLRSRVMRVAELVDRFGRY